MRRLTSVARVAAARMYTPPEDLQKIFASDLENAKYPTDLVPSDSILFAKFLFKACEAKGNFDAVTKDFETIQAASAKLPIFWERNAELEKIAEFKGLNPATTFTLFWMQDNGMLEMLPAVREAFETYVSAQRNTVTAKIYVGDAKDTKSVEAAKKAAQAAHKDKRTLAFKVVVDTDIVSGFAVDIAGCYISDAKGKEVAAAASSADVDYTNVPAPKLFKTIWDDNVETEVLRKYFDQLALYDQEEAKIGV